MGMEKTVALRLLGWVVENKLTRRETEKIGMERQIKNKIKPGIRWCEIVCDLMRTDLRNLMWV